MKSRRFKSRSGEQWYKTRCVQGKVECTCKGFTYHGTCWHTTKMLTEYKIKVDKLLDDLYRWLDRKIKKAGERT